MNAVFIRKLLVFASFALLGWLFVTYVIG